MKAITIIFGIIMIIVGILGYVPAMTPDGNLFGYFRVDSVHNIVHILTGIIALLAAANYAKLYFKIFGFIYLIVAILGFFLAGNLILFHVNMADNILHFVIAAVALYLGFTKKIV